jgi:hypothetical protein
LIKFLRKGVDSMELLTVSVVATVAIISVSVVTLKAIKMILSDEINLAKKIKKI